MADPDVLVLFAHPALERARVGPALAKVAQDAAHVELRDLYELYPDFTIDVAAEQKALSRARAVILQFPMYWYSTPALMKEWMDLVLTHGFAYGAQGVALKGKYMACAISTGGKAFAYDQAGHNHYTISDFLRPLEQTARLCRMTWKAPFIVHDAPSLSERELTSEAVRYAAWLGKYSKAKA